jgi:hypothetical protein
MFSMYFLVVRGPQNKNPSGVPAGSSMLSWFQKDPDVQYVVIE